MNRDGETSTGLPIACTLTEDELATMREGLLPGLLAKATSRESTAGGFRWQFQPQSGLLARAAAVIDAERRCCQFMRFLLVVEPGEGPVWLEVTGPEGTKDFLSTLGTAAPGTPKAT
jgi:hypothetical protein